MSYTSEQLINQIGRDKISRRIGVGLTAVSNAAVKGSIPASWYEVIRDECDRLGVDCPTYLFSFKRGTQPAPNERVRVQ